MCIAGVSKYRKLASRLVRRSADIAPMLGSAPMTRRPVLRAVIALTLVVPGILLTVPARADGGYGATVSAIDDAFDQQVIRIQPGESVEWTMDGRAPHTVTADDGSWDSGDLQPGAEFSHPFARPGVYS